MTAPKQESTASPKVPDGRVHIRYYDHALVTISTWQTFCGIDGKDIDIERTVTRNEAIERATCKTCRRSCSTIWHHQALSENNGELT